VDDLEPLILRARDQHDGNDGANSDDVSAAEERLGYRLPHDLKRILHAANGLRFWASADYPCRLLSTTEMEPVSVLLQRDDGPPGIIAIIELQGDFVGIDLDPTSKSFSRLIDCSHETFPYELFGICDSSTSALKLILESDGREWVWPAVLAYDTDFAE
jgi:hypothetical protein